MLVFGVGQREAGCERQLVVDLSGNARERTEVDQRIFVDQIAPRPVVSEVLGKAAAKNREPEIPVILEGHHHVA